MFFKLLFIDQIADSVTHCVTCSDKKKTITALADGKCLVNGLFRNIAPKSPPSQISLRELSILGVEIFLYLLRVVAKHIQSW